MKLVRFFVPGRFEDAYLYMGHLIAITREGTMRLAPIGALLDLTLGSHGSSRRLARLLFERNDELHREANRSWVVAALVRERTQLDELATRSRENLREATINGTFREFDLDLGDAVPLDLLVYNQRLFLSSTNGLFHLDLQFDPWPAEPRGEVRRRLDARCLAVSARFGTIAASAEEEGLFVALDEFSWAETDGRTRRLRRVANRSRRTSWASFGLYNYETNREPQPIFGDVVTVTPKGVEQERTIISSITGRGDIRPVEEKLGAAGLPVDSIQYVWSTLSGLFVHGQEGALRFVRVELGDAETIAPGRPFVLPDIPGRVISASSSGRFSVVETDFAIWAVVDGQRDMVVDAEAISVRTYSSSRWFKNVTTATLEDGILLTAVLGRPLSAEQEPG